MKNIIAGLDMGTSKICAAIAGQAPDGERKLMGVGSAESRGINKGFVSNIDKLVDSIQEALAAAQDQAGTKVNRVVANISGSSVSGNVHEGITLLSRRGREITKKDVKKVLDLARNTSLTMERELLFNAAQDFIVDDAHEVEDPIGLFGSKLKVRLYIVSALTTHVQNISKAVNYAGYDLVDVMPNPVAASYGVLSEQEKKEGVFLIDIGGGVTEFALLGNNRFYVLDSINVGGMDLTACISSFYKIPFTMAEMIKKRYGGISKEEAAKAHEDILEFDGRQIVVKSDEVNKLLRERFEEMYNIVNERLAFVKGQASFSQVVVTGGGSLLSGAIESLGDLFGADIRLGRVNGLSGDPSLFSNPLYSSAVSLAKYGSERYARRPKPIEGRIFILDIFSRLKELMEEYF